MPDMTMRVPAAQAKARFADLLRRAETGEEVIVTRNGAAVARIGPVRARVGGFMRGEVVVHDDTWWHAADDLADA